MKTHAYWMIIFVCIVIITLCNPNNLINGLDNHENVWIKFDNELLRTIIDSQIKYKSFPKNVKLILKQQIKTDFNLFSDGITLKMVELAATYGTRYQLINHTLFRQKECLFPSRCEGIDYFLKKLTNLSDFEIIVNTRDYPQVSKHFNTKIPIFSFSKTDDYIDIMYPAWSFWCGGPAIKLYPVGIGRWDKLRKSLIKKSDEWPWEKKKSIGFFRGSRTSSERDELIYLSREVPELIDAAYTKNQAWKSPEDTLNAEPAAEILFEDHCYYKYLFNFRGVAASFRFKHLFLCKSLVFHVGDEWKEFFYGTLKPWVHYVPIKKDYKREDVKNILIFFQKHDDIARKIAEDGFNLIKDHLKISTVTWYWKNLLKEYVKLQKFNPTFNKALMKIS